MAELAFLVPEQEAEITISHSQSQTWLSCEKKWEYSYVDLLTPKAKKKTYELGTLFHELTAVYDQFLQQGVPAGDKFAWDRVAQYANEDWPTGKILDELELYHAALLATKRYIMEHSFIQDKYVTVLGVEDHFEIEQTTPKGRLFKIQGYIDRFHKEEGKYWLLDRKTSRTGKHYTDNQILMDPQLLLYAAIYREMGFDIFGVAIDSVSTYPYKNYMGENISKLMKRIRSYRSDHEMKFVFKHYGEIVDQILDKRDAGGPFVRNLSRECSYCQYQELCLYTMKGIDTDFLVEAAFEKKQAVDKRVEIVHNNGHGSAEHGVNTSQETLDPEESTNGIETHQTSLN